MLRPEALMLSSQLELSIIGPFPENANKPRQAVMILAGTNPRELTRVPGLHVRGWSPLSFSRRVSERGPALVVTN